MAPSKTFNLAGMSAAVTIIGDTELHERFAKQAGLEQGEYINLFGMTVFEAAYRYGRPWYEQLLAYIAENERTVRRFFAEHFPAVFLCAARRYLPYVVRPFFAGYGLP